MTSQQPPYDKVIKKDKTAIEGKVLRVTATSIEIDPKGPIPFLIINRGEVQAIIYGDNTVVTFDRESASNAGTSSNIESLPEFVTAFTDFQCGFLQVDCYFDQNTQSVTIAEYDGSMREQGFTGTSWLFSFSGMENREVVVEKRIGSWNPFFVSVKLKPGQYNVIVRGQRTTYSPDISTLKNSDKIDATFQCQVERYKCTRVRMIRAVQREESGGTIFTTPKVGYRETTTMNPPGIPYFDKSLLELFGKNSLMEYDVSD